MNFMFCFFLFLFLPLLAVYSNVVGSAILSVGFLQRNGGRDWNSRGVLFTGFIDFGIWMIWKYLGLFRS